jgi:glycosyltransferase involved in cell wall biosynthesis
MKILLVSEEITNRPHEGSLVFLMHLGRFLHREGELTVVHALGEFDPDIRSLRSLSRKTFVTRELLRLARGERFDVVLYVPQPGLTPFGIGRGALLRLLTKSPTIAIGLQERRVSRLHALLRAFGKPDLVLSPVRSLREGLERLGIDTGFIMPGFDDRLFKPASPEIRAQLKSKYDFPRDRYVLLHVGHMRESRNLEVLLRYRNWGLDVQPVVKASQLDPAWVHRLRMAGIIVVDEYSSDMHELYQASDCYFSPMNGPTEAVDIPLSVIEACACNLPVLAARFGALAEAIREGNGFIYYDRVSEIAEKIAAIRLSRPETAAKVREFSWEKIFRSHLYPQMQSLVRESGGEGAP